MMIEAIRMERFKKSNCADKYALWNQDPIGFLCSAPGSLDTSLSYAAWRSLCASRASIGV